MSLRVKIVYIFFVLAGLACLGQVAVMQAVVFPKFIQLEEQGARRDMERIQQGITAEIKNVDILCHDWGAWDDSVDFVEGRKPGFVETNIPPEFFETASIDYLHFIDPRGVTTYFRAIDPITGKKFSVADFEVKEGERSSLIFLPGMVSDQETGDLVRSGLIYVDSIPEPLSLVARPILASSNDGPIRGTIIMGRFLKIDSLQQQIGVNVRFLPLHAVEDAVDREVLDLLQSGETPPLLRYVDDSIRFYRLQDSLYGGPLCLVMGEKPAEVIRHGTMANRTAILSFLVVFVLLLCAVFFIFSEIVTGPLRFLSAKTKEIIKSGHFSTAIEVEGVGEIADLGRSINGLLERITSHEKLLFVTNNKLLEQSLTDSLTGLSNRRDFDVYVGKEWTRLQRSQLPLSVIMCDVDYFKKYNDAYGHQQGDTCLQSLATALQDVVKRPTDLVARYGGEEFVLILPETGGEGALHVAQQVCEQIRSLKMEHAVSSVCPWVTMSVGVATMIPREGANSDYLLRMADEALYKAKEQGRNRVVATTNM